MSIRVFLMVWALLLPWSAKGMELRFVTGEFLSFDFSSRDTSSGATPPVARGPFVETVQAVCAHIHYDCPIGLVPWRRSLAMLEQGQTDAVFAVIPAYEQAVDLRFSPVLIDSSLDIYVHSSNPLRGWRPENGERRDFYILGPSGTANVVRQRLQDIPSAHIHLEFDNLRLMRKLDAGRFDDGMVIMNPTIARRLIEEHKLGNVREAGLFKKVGYAIAFSRERVSPEKFEAFERGLQVLIADGTVAAIFQRYQLKLAPSALKWAARKRSAAPQESCRSAGGSEEYGGDIHRGAPADCPVMAFEPVMGP
ncbi:amino acid ABC transporter periplasmic protein [Azotobacter vinelandii CA]|uniref:Amino acid ABC transporter periplasmic protein n=2 Tax=Azotobacter vinelandii TaxID=354 RepID=C1DSE2_AZOVD|nr:transporter substrate-binding domain-containing protein [Azotobacter vinelandii]ACO77897.1 amino acid ABC transporter periplasmic protein [Azotobacter vinelandii DJ]AGK15230.1 amino acid ABC transporter periplasmic protein [Azotobacter vinelandii CA]AGK20061.1 amino acid ABC transporter periplasmic protein [Azotobacter vinelandii CA6]WKN23634.1 transporter substrate-binding domain-containing protein [Azotobacter vinelandii]SFY29942.1 amino acid ABC transporter substrate-binding protein, PAA